MEAKTFCGFADNCGYYGRGGGAYPFDRRNVFLKDGVIYLVGIAVNVIYMLTVLSPLTILMIWVAIYRALKRNNIRISRSFYVVSALVEVVSLAVSVYITIKDITTP